MSGRPALTDCDLVRYEEEVFLAVLDAVQHYVGLKKDAKGEVCSQAAVYTEPFWGYSSVYFLTKEHSAGRGAFRVSDPAGDGRLAYTLICPLHPSEFDFKEYHCVFHPSLRTFRPEVNPVSETQSERMFP
jgi:hypothetical protein